MRTLLHCRLSDGVSRAVPFSADDARSLSAGAASAFTTFGDSRATLELQVRPITREVDGWFAPVRDARPVRVFVSAAILHQRPPDDWTEIWAWCVQSRAQDHALARLLSHPILDGDRDA